MAAAAHYGRVVHEELGAAVVLGIMRRAVAGDGDRIGIAVRARGRRGRHVAYVDDPAAALVGYDIAGLVIGQVHARKVVGHYVVADRLVAGDALVGRGFLKEVLAGDG